MVESSSQPLFSIAIRTIGRRYPILKQILYHIDQTDLGLPPSDFEVVVSEDGPPYTLSEERLNKELSRIKVRYTPNTRTKGMGGNRNASALAATGKYLVLIDDDILLPPNLLRALIDAFNRAGENAIFSILLGTDLTPPSTSTPKWVSYVFPPKTPDNILDNNSLPSVPLPTSYEEYWYAIGGLTCMSRLRYIEVGGYPEPKPDDLFPYSATYDDGDFTFRAQSLGCTVYALKDVRIGHLDDHFINTDKAINRLLNEGFSHMILRRLHPDKAYIHNAVDIFWHSNLIVRTWRIVKGEIFSTILPILAFLAKRKAISPFLTRKLADAIWIGATYKGLKDGKKVTYQHVLIHEPPFR